MDDLERLLGTRMRQPDVPVPDAVEAAVLGAARAAAGGFRRRHRHRLRLVRRTVAVAAAVLVASWLGVGFLAGPERPFDVVDAWRVAAGMEDSTARFDLNRDGRVDRADADAMLTRIVALAPPRRS